MREAVRRRRFGAAITSLALFVSIVTVTPATPAGAVDTVIDDFEDGDASDWVFFGGNAAGGGGGVLSDRPQEGGFYLSTGWGGNGTDSVFYGGFFKNFDDSSQITAPTDPVFNVWVLNQSNATVDQYTLEITLREDLDGNGWTDGSEDSFRLDTTFNASSFNDQWILLSAPLSGFTDLQTGGDGTFNGALDEVVVVVAGVEGGPGSTVEVDFDRFSFTTESTPGPNLVDDFESGVTPATPCAPSSPPLGFCTFNGAGSSVSLTNPATPPAPELPAVGTPNSVLQMDIDSTTFAGFIHGFENSTGDAWTPQDWSTREGISLWFHGTGSDSQLFIDILDNRNPGSTTDDAERWSVPFVDDFTGWQLLEFPFSSFVRKEVGNGAPNDGLGLFEMHGYAIGGLGTGGPRTYYIDSVSLFGVAEPPALAVSFTRTDTPIEEGTTGEVGVKLNRSLGADDPDEVSVEYATDIAGAIAGEEYTPTSGTLTFVKGGSTELSFPIETFDDSKFEGEERIVLRLSNPDGVELGSPQARALIVDNEAFDPLLLDDFEKGAFLWDSQGPVEFATQRTEAGEPGARPGQDAVENIFVASVPLSVDVAVMGNVCGGSNNGLVPVHLLSTAEFDATTVDHSSVRFGDAAEAHANRRTGAIQRHVDDVNNDGRDDLVFHFRRGAIDGGCDRNLIPFNGVTFAGQPITAGGSDAAVGRDFALAQDWTGTESLSFWYDGSGGGEPITVTLKDNRAPDSSEFELVWSDEFDGPAGTPPNEANWAYEIGDGALNGIEGWGNSELQYYTDDPANAATDGNGNLVITLDEADGSKECFYGTCEYTSARLITKDKAEFAYGRIESRLLVPDGGDGLWPAFWSLGTDITYNPWPAAGEIDFMEYVSRLPNEIFGTIHGPGYNGGNAFGNVYDFGEPVSGEYHTFVTEWEPNKITWYVDGIQYHQATPSDVAGPWVFEKPFYLLLNFAIGGNFGGPIDPANTYPQEYLVDYIRVYQGPDTAERFEASFVDDFTGWQQVTVPMTDFVRSGDQPENAPNDGLGLDEVWGYGFALPEGNATGELRIDFVERNLIPPPSALTVDTLDDSGPGSIREALALIALDGTITFDPALADGTISLTDGQLVIGRSVTIDGSDAPGLTVSGNSASRVFQVAPGVDAQIHDLVVADGAGAPRGGGILNFGTLTLNRVIVTNNTETSGGGASFDLGGGGIYNGDGATLNLVESTVSNNATVGQPGGGIYGFFNSTLNITRSTVSGNVAGDVAGGIRALGTVNITNSTLSGNTSTAWHGGAAFLTDGVTTILNSTIVDNTAPLGTAGGVFVGTFGDSAATLTLQNTIVADNGDPGCFQGFFGGGTVTLTSLGNNVFTDGSCNPIASDQVDASAGVGALADNGGPTLTHALLTGSPALDTADTPACPAIDQRGISRPQGAACDIGAYEEASG